jgi:hypothetical protein
MQSSAGFRTSIDRNASSSDSYIRGEPLKNRSQTQESEYNRSQSLDKLKFPRIQLFVRRESSELVEHDRGQRLRPDIVARSRMQWRAGELHASFRSTVS